LPSQNWIKGMFKQYKLDLPSSYRHWHPDHASSSVCHGVCHGVCVLPWLPIWFSCMSTQSYNVVNGTSWSARTGGSMSEPVLVRWRPVRNFYGTECSTEGWVCDSRPLDDPMPILLSANRNPYQGFQFSRILGMGSHTNILGMGFETRYITSKQHSCVHCPLRECRSICASNLWTTLVLRTTCKRSWCPGRVSSVEALQTNKQTNKIR